MLRGQRAEGLSRGEVPCLSPKAVHPASWVLGASVSPSSPPAWTLPRLGAHGPLPVWGGQGGWLESMAWGTGKEDHHSRAFLAPPKSQWGDGGGRPCTEHLGGLGLGRAPGPAAQPHTCPGPAPGALTWKEGLGAGRGHEAGEEELVSPPLSQAWVRPQVRGSLVCCGRGHLGEAGRHGGGLGEKKGVQKQLGSEHRGALAGGGGR